MVTSNQLELNLDIHLDISVPLSEWLHPVNQIYLHFLPGDSNLVEDADSKLYSSYFQQQGVCLLVLGRSSIIIYNQSYTSLILINRLQNWQSEKVTPSGKI